MKLRWPGSSFRRVLMVQVVALLVGWAVWIVNYWWQYTWVASPTEGSLRTDLALVAQTLADAAAIKPDPAHVQARLDGLHGGYQNLLRVQTPHFGYVVWRADGSVLAARRAQAEWWPPDARAGPGEQKLSVAEPGAAAGDWFSIRRSSADGRFTAAAAVQRAALDEQLWLLMRATLLPTLWIVPFMLPTTLLIAWIATQPVRRLSQAIADRDASDLGPVPDDHRFAELRPVGRAVNRWLDALRGTRERERAFFANAAHELRTPLAAIGAYTHTLQRGGGTAETAAALGASVQRMTALLDKLLLLSRLDSQAQTQAMQALDLAALARSRVAAFGPRAVRKHITLALEAPATAPLQGHAEALESVLDNLLENALRYTPEGGEVLVSLSAGEAGAWRLLVQDNGPGVPEALRERVFDRFFRAAPAGEPGTGLGLAIVREAVAQHGGQVVLDSGLGGRGLGVQVTLPGTA